MIRTNDFPTRWRCVYWFPSNKFVGDQSSEYTMESHWDGDTLVLESLPNEEDAHMVVRLLLDGEIAAGDWHETTSPTGEFKGAKYSGAGQLVVSAETHFMEGKWAGAGYDRKLKKTRIYCGNWEISPVRGDAV